MYAEIATLLFLLVLAVCSCAPLVVDYFLSIMDDGVEGVVDWEQNPKGPPIR